MLKLGSIISTNTAGGKYQPVMKTIETVYNVNKENIGYIRFIFEAYDGIAIVTTISEEKDKIAVYTAPGCEDEVESLIADLAKTIKIKKKA